MIASFSQIKVEAVRSQFKASNTISSPPPVLLTFPLDHENTAFNQYNRGYDNNRTTLN